MATKIKIEVHDTSKQALGKLADDWLEAMREVFEGPILDEARSASPVGKGPVQPGEKRNRDSIETKVYMARRGPFAKIYTTSGHGGFLEMGYTHVGSKEEIVGRPYIAPAVQANLPRILELVKAKGEEDQKKT